MIFPLWVWVIIAGGSLFLKGLHSLSKYNRRRALWEASQKWPMVKGRATEPSLGGFQLDESAMDSSQRRWAVAFDYTVDGKSYQSAAVVRPGTNPGDEGDVWYNPENPAQSVMTLEYPSGNKKTLVLAISQASGGAVIALAVAVVMAGQS